MIKRGTKEEKGSSKCKKRTEQEDGEESSEKDKISNNCATIF